MLASILHKLASKISIFLMPCLLVISSSCPAAAVVFSRVSPDRSEWGNRSDEHISQQGPVIVGEVERQTLRVDYWWQANKGHTITQPGASFIKVHFLTLDLNPGDFVTVSDPTGAETYTYPGSDSASDGQSGFWSTSITGDTAVVQLHSQRSSRELFESAITPSGFVIDQYGWGYAPDQMERIVARSTCGAKDQRKDVTCYQDTNPSEFDSSKAVARLLVYHPDGYYGFCTAWRAGVGATMLTNQHCLESQTEVAGSEVWFNYQNEACGIASVGDVTKVTGNTLLTSDLTLDFALFTVNDPESIAHFGFLDIDARTPILGEQIYIPQHGGGGPKQFGIESDLNAGNLCRIDAPVIDGLDNGTDTGYYCDTGNGSSGSPVLASSSHKVIAIHHFGNTSAPACTTPNQGVRMDLIWPRVEPYLLQVEPFGSVDNYNPTFTWKRALNATWYYLWVNGPSGNVVKQWYQAANICDASICSVTSPVGLSVGRHTWWLQTWSDAGSGPWSNGMSFNVPSLGKARLISPIEISSVQRPLYMWEEVPHSTWYYLRVNGPTGIVIQRWYRTIDICADGVCSVEDPTTLGKGAHTWSVQAYNMSARDGPLSDPLTFLVMPAGLSAKASLMSPTSNIDSDNPIYTWNEASGSTWYYLWVNGPSGNIFKQWYTSAQANCNGTTCSIAGATPNLGSGSYTWWIQTYNAAGDGPWSDAMSFTMTPPGLPRKASLVSPERSIGTNTPTYTWNEVEGATWYYLWVNGPPGTVIQHWYTTAEANCNGGTCSITPSTTLSPGTHTWWIQTYGTAGDGPWSDPKNFLIP